MRPNVRQRLIFAALIGFLAGDLFVLPARAAQRPIPVRTEVIPPAVFAARLPAPSGVLILPLSGAEDLDARIDDLGAEVGAGLRRGLASARFAYRPGQTLMFRGLGDWDGVLVIGLPSGSRAADYQRTGTIAGRLLIGESGSLVMSAQGLPPEGAADLATGLGLGIYRSDLYANSTVARPSPGPLILVADEAAAADRLYSGRGRALVEAMAFTRDITNEPANVIYPESFVERSQAAFAGTRDVSIEVLDVAAMERLGMGAILGVGRGSPRPPRLLVVRYRSPHTPASQGPVVLIGKGITFDSGGISIKPAANMGAMKMDMAGAASVVGAVLALARQSAPVDVVAIAALAENMPDGGAIRPGDVLSTMSGRTIEITSTDAEGRLVLADAIDWAEAHLNPAVIIDVATLTGGVGAALGDDYAGLMTRHEDLAAQLMSAGRTSGEPLWRLPLHPSYASENASSIADTNNSGGNPSAGTGGYFIGSFVDPVMPWAHLDIASVAFGPANELKPAGASGYGVRLLERFVLDWRPVTRGVGTGGF